MNEVFNYNDVFMGAIPGKRKNYSRSFKDDYRLKRLTESVTRKSGKMLDIGCGGGILTESLHYYFPKMKLYGCDVSKTAITYAKKFGSGRVTYGVIKEKKLPYKNNSMDVCVCLDVMEHIPDVEYFLKEVKRILKKNGQFFLLVPCEGQPFTYTWFFNKIRLGHNMTFKNWGHIHPEFTHKSVEKLLKKYGFNIRRKTYSEHFLYQTANFLMYFFPKEIMNFILRDRAEKYTDRAMILDMKNKKKHFDIMIYIRNSWLYISRIIYFIPEVEIEVLKNNSFSAWKAHFLAVIENK